MHVLENEYDERIEKEVLIDLLKSHHGLDGIYYCSVRQLELQQYACVHQWEVSAEGCMDQGVNKTGNS